LIDSLRRIARSTIRKGLPPTRIDQLAFEFYSLLLGFHLYATLLDNADLQKRQQTAFDTLVNTYRQKPGTQS
jgi:hypothetical protein